MNARKILTTIIIILMIFFGFVFGKNIYSYKIPNNSMGVRSVVAQKKIDTLFIGSSGYRKGVDMNRIISSVPGNSFMLTYNGNEPFNIYIELKELLKENVEIGTLIVDLNPTMAEKDADLSDKRLLFDISMAGKQELWNKIKENPTSDLFTFYDYWVLSNNDYLITYPLSFPLISSRYYYGGGTNNDITEGKTYEELAELPVSEGPEINPLQKDSIINIINLCHDNGIDLIFLESPRYSTLENDINYSNKLHELVNLISSYNVKCITYEDINFDINSAELFSDLTHLSGDGRDAFTADIIRYLTIDK